MALLIRFRSARYKRLAEMAVAQGFTLEMRGSRHAGVICPTCGTCIVLSTTQRDNADYKYRNQVAYLRRHGLNYENETGRQCLGRPYGK